MPLVIKAEGLDEVEEQVRRPVIRPSHFHSRQSCGGLAK